MFRRKYSAELRNRQELVDNFNQDALTLLYNRHRFNVCFSLSKGQTFPVEIGVQRI